MPMRNKNLFLRCVECVSERKEEVRKRDSISHLQIFANQVILKYAQTFASRLCSIFSCVSLYAHKFSLKCVIESDSVLCVRFKAYAHDFFGGRTRTIFAKWRERHNTLRNALFTQFWKFANFKWFLLEINFDLKTFSYACENDVIRPYIRKF